MSPVYRFVDEEFKKKRRTVRGPTPNRPPPAMVEMERLFAEITKRTRDCQKLEEYVFANFPSMKINPEGYISYSNRQLYELFGSGIDHRNLLGRHFTEIIDPSYIEKVQVAFFRNEFLRRERLLRDAWTRGEEINLAALNAKVLDERRYSRPTVGLDLLLRRPWNQGDTETIPVRACSVGLYVATTHPGKVREQKFFGSLVCFQKREVQ